MDRVECKNGFVCFRFGIISAGQRDEVVGHLRVAGGDREEHADVPEGRGRTSESCYP